MFLAGHDSDRTGIDRDHRLIGAVASEATGRTADPAGREEIQQVRALLCSQSTRAGKLVEMLLTAGEGDGQFVHEEKRDRFSSRRAQRCLAGLAGDRRLGIVRNRLSALWW